ASAPPLLVDAPAHPSRVLHGRSPGLQFDRSGERTTRPLISDTVGRHSVCRLAASPNALLSDQAERTLVACEGPHRSHRLSQLARPGTGNPRPSPPTCAYRQPL